MPKRSKVWLHFAQVDTNRARCSICQKVVLAKDGNTSNLAKHLIMHKINLRSDSCSVFDCKAKKAKKDDGTSVTRPPPSSTSNSLSASDRDSAGSLANNITASAPPLTIPEVRKTLPGIASVNPFTLAERGKMTKDQREECHRVVTKFIVKGLLPFSTVDTPWWREMIAALNPKYQSPTRDMVSNTFVPAWYAVEKENVKRELEAVRDVAVTADGWTSVAQDHYLTVSVHYIIEGAMKEKILHTQAVYVSQTGVAIAEEIGDILEEFGVKEKVVAITVDNAANMDVAVRRMSVRKIGCFAHTLNIAAQKIYTIPSVARWAGRVRALLVWLKRCTLSKPVLKEKQKILGLPEHSVILDVKTRWNSLYLMMERFLEMFPAIQAACMDPRLKKSMEKERLDRISGDDFRKAEEFVKLMKIMYQSTVCISSGNNATLGQIIPIIKKLQDHFRVTADDSFFSNAIKEKVWDDLSKRYQGEGIQEFLEEGTALDPRFKGKVEDAVWYRLEEELIDRASHQNRGETAQAHQQVDDGDSSCDEASSAATEKLTKLSALEELFMDEDIEVGERNYPIASQRDKVKEEIRHYRGLPSTLSTVDPVTWWWDMRGTLPALSSLAARYLCVQASATPSERTFSTAGDTISQERACLLPDKADMLIFLKKNC
ncbi:zinc finger BED domain-containing protein 1-like isoform X1 [Gadus morhua]|uniref:zinc finger BED domain-containing protein 1-like isoform X1 n=1 Tax=Gadus morhua TaxID=8049 RepID=UPI0011B7F30B|nr:zinc finger BED domain-containing protein 1-like isoform X1 [Gadus morhua]